MADSQKVEEAKALIKGKNEHELREMMSKGELSPIMNDSELKEKFFAGELRDPKSDEAGGGDPSKTPAGQEDPKPEKSASPEDASSEDGFGGYGSQEALLKATKHQAEMIRSQKGKLDTVSADRGKLGQKVKDMEADFKAQMNKLEQKLSAAPVSKPPEEIKIPELPKFESAKLDPSSDFYDEKFAKQYDAHQALIADAFGKSQEAFKALEKKGKLDKEAYNVEVKKLNDKMGKIDEFMETTKTEKASSENDKITEKREKNHSNLAEEIEKFRKGKKIALSRPFIELDKDINDHSTPKEGGGVLHDPAHANTLPPEDLKTHGLIMQLINMCGQFDKNGLYYKSNVLSMDEAYDILEKRSGGNAKEIIEAERRGRRQVEDAKKNNAQGAVNLPNSVLGGEGGKAAMTRDQKIARFKELAALPSSTISRNPDLAKEWDTLKLELSSPKAAS